MNARRTIRCARAALVAAALLAGCGRELVGGGQREVETYATGGGSSSAGAAPAPLRVAAGGAPVLQTSGGITGTVTVDARVSLVRGGARAPAGAGSATVRADGGDTARVARGVVPSGGYDAARIAFTRASAQVTGGLAIGGAEVTGRFDVVIADSVVVEVPVQVSGTGTPVRLLVELDAATWLRTADPLTRTVSPTAFRSAVRVRTF